MTSAAAAVTTDLLHARPATGIRLRPACTEDAHAIHALIFEHQVEGRLLPRDLAEVGAHAHRFVVAEVADAEASALRSASIVACAELAPLSRTVGEVRSFVVRNSARGEGLGSQMIDELVARARTAGFEKLCAFTHAPGYFVQRGFSIVPHVWVPEKIVRDCHGCLFFRRCEQYALVRPLHRVHG